MERITITIDDALLRSIDEMAARRGYPSRSEAIRELLRDAALRDPLTGAAGDCFATLTYVYDHATRALGARLIEQQHDHHDLGVCTMHVHVDSATCLEVAILKGPVEAVRACADELTVQRGVRDAALHLIPVPASRAGHEHEHGHGNGHAASVLQDT